MVDFSAGNMARVGAALQGRLPEFEQQRTQAEMLRQQQQDRRDKKNKELSQERLVAMARDAQTAEQYLDMGAVPEALELLDNRIGFINQYGGDPSDTQEMRDLIASGDIEGAQRELKLFTTASVTNGLVKPLVSESEKQGRERLEMDKAEHKANFGEGELKARELALKEHQKKIDDANLKLAQERFNFDKERGLKGTIPPGFKEVDGKLQPMEGSPAASEIDETQKALGLAQADYDRKFDIVDSTITEAIKIIENEGRWAAGVGSILKDLPESSARNLAAKLETIGANLGFEELQTMRANSPTGGGLGNISEREIAFLQAIQGNLDQGLAPEELYKVLKDVQSTRSKFRDERSKILSNREPKSSDQPLSVSGYAIKALD